MHRSDHPLPGQSLGRQTTVSSLHFGVAGARPKAYVQASLHAEELPGMLAAHHLRGLLEAAVQQGRLIGEVVLVPVANPIGLAQRVDHKAMGRFELDSSANFNRHYPNLAGAPPALPQARCAATPLAGSQTVKATTANIAGSVAFRTGNLLGA